MKTGILLMPFFMLSCNDKPVKQWSDKGITDWWNHSEWSEDLAMLPDQSINRRMFAE